MERSGEERLGETTENKEKKESVRGRGGREREKRGEGAVVDGADHNEPNYSEGGYDQQGRPPMRLVAANQKRQQ